MTKKDKNFMDINETRAEQDIDMDEVLMQRVADAILDDELKAFDEACEKYKDSDFEADMDERLQAIFDKHDEIEKKKNRAAKTKRFAKIAAVIVLALGVFGTAGYFSTTEAFRAELLNLIFKAHDKYDEVVVDENNQQPVDSEENNSGETEEHFALQLDYVPDGYELVKNTSNDIMYEYIHDRDKYIYLSYCNPNATQHTDNEIFSTERVYLNGNEIELRYDKVNYFAMWKDKEQYFSLAAAYIDKETVLKIIEGIGWSEDK